MGERKDQPMSRIVVLVSMVLLLAGCGDRPPEAADHIPPVPLSQSTIDRELTEAGVGAQLIQSLSETAQGASYDRIPYATVSWRRSQDLALVALHRCRATEAGTATWRRYVASDQGPDISRRAAVKVNRFMAQEFCPALVN
jgi:type IV pilus biogenesis protein CpaD/CtpE